MSELDVVRQLLDGDEAAFAALVEQLHPSIVRLACAFVRDRATAEEVAQDAWLAVLNGLASFQGKSSLKSWIFAIVVNRAKSRGKREARSIPFSALASEESRDRELAVSPDRFLGPDTQWPGHWMRPPESWGDNPEVRLLHVETMGILAQLLDQLPPAQRSVVIMRDVAGFDPETICNELDVSETNMRVLLHRGRSRLRAALEQHRGL